MMAGVVGTTCRRPWAKYLEYRRMAGRVASEQLPVVVVSCPQ